MGQGPWRVIPACHCPILLTVPPSVWPQALDKLREAKAEDIQVTSDRPFWWAPCQCPVLLGMSEHTQLPLLLWPSGRAPSLPLLKFLECPDQRGGGPQSLLYMTPPTPFLPSWDGDSTTKPGELRPGGPGLLDS